MGPSLSSFRRLAAVLLVSAICLAALVAASRGIRPSLPSRLASAPALTFQTVSWMSLDPMTSSPASAPMSSDVPALVGLEAWVTPSTRALGGSASALSQKRGERLGEYCSFGCDLWPSVAWAGKGAPCLQTGRTVAMCRGGLRTNQYIYLN